MPNTNDKSPVETLKQLSAVHPIFAWWSIPAIMMEGWLAAMNQMTGMMTKTDGDSSEKGK